MILSFINIRKVPREMLKTSGFVLGFQLLPRDLANVNEWKIMFDPYITNTVAAADTIRAGTRQNQQNNLCSQQRLRSACVSAKPDQSIRGLHEEALGPWLRTEPTVKIVRLI